MLKDKFMKYCALEEPKWIIKMSQEDFEKNCKWEQGKVTFYVYEDTNRMLYSKVSPRLNEINDQWKPKIDL